MLPLRHGFAYSRASRCDSLASLFCGRKAHDDPNTNEVDDLFHADGLLAGCVEMIVPGQLDALKSGPIQPIADYKSAIQSYLHDNLRDSISAVLEYAQPVRDVHLDNPVAGVSHFISCCR